MSKNIFFLISNFYKPISFSFNQISNGEIIVVEININLLWNIKINYESFLKY